MARPDILPCGRCPEIICNTFQILGQVVSGSATTCGWQKNISDGAWLWRKRTRTYTGVGDLPLHPGFSTTGTITIVEEYNTNCDAPSYACSGSITAVLLETATYDCTNLHDILAGLVLGVNVTTTFENQWTPAELKAVAISRIPAWPTTPFTDDAPSASWISNSPMTVRRCRWKVVHAPTNTCYFKSWLRKLFLPFVDGGFGDPEPTDLDPYVWSPAASPCVPDPSKSATALVNRISSDVFELDEPDDEGAVSPQVTKYSIREGYEPAEPVDTDGTRPCPDVTPNCTPAFVIEEGCTDLTASNYDPTKCGTDFSTCIYPIYGCMDPAATNYDPTATVDSGFCEYG